MSKIFDWEVNDLDNWIPVLRSFVGPRLFKKNAYRPVGPNHQNFDFTLQNAAGGVLTSGTVFVTGIDLHAGQTISKLWWFSGSTALVAGSSQNYWLALYDQSGNVLGQSTTNTSKAIAASSLIGDSLATPVVLGYTGMYYVGIMNSQTSGTMPTFGGYTGLATVTATVSASGLKFSGTADASLTATATSPMGAITGVATLPWVGVS